MGIINTTNLFNNSRGFDYTLNALNAASNFLFGDFLLVAIFVILLFSLRNSYFTDGLLSASVVTFLFSLMLWASGFIDFARVVVCFAVMIVAVAMSYMKE
jgi:phage-related holin